MQSGATGGVEGDRGRALSPADRGGEAPAAAAHAAIQAALATVLSDTGRSPRAVTGGMLLAADVGLDSLDLAQTIVLLERSLGVDPFRLDGGSRPPLRTVDDLVRIYATAIAAAPPANGSPAASPQDPSPA